MDDAKIERSAQGLITGMIVDLTVEEARLALTTVLFTSFVLLGSRAGADDPARLNMLMALSSGLSCGNPDCTGCGGRGSDGSLH